MNEMNSYLNIALELKELAPRLANNSIAEEESVLKLCNNIDEKLADFKPNLMVYGCYNAGKSTLLNAILGTEQAKMGDTPETFKVDSYEFKNYKIWDTPGIHAPIEHENVTFEHYKKCEAILFVMSNDSGFEEKYIYERIQEIVSHKKPLIIVLNDKRGFGSDSEEIARQSEKIIENLAKMQLSNSEVEKIKIISVNAKSALKGKLESKNLLIKNSNINELEDYIYKCLEDSGKTEIIRTLNHQINDFVSGLIKSTIDKEENKEIQEIQELLSDVISQEKDAKKQLSQTIKYEVAPMEEELYNAIISGEQNLSSIIKRNVDIISRNIANNFDLIQNNLTQSLSKYATSSLQVSLPEMNSIDSSITSEIIDGLSSQITTEGVKIGTEEATKFVLFKIKDWLPTLMKGKGPAWIAKIAGGAAVVVGPLLTIGSMLYSHWKEEREEEEREKKLREMYITARNAAKDICYKISKNLEENALEQIKEMFSDKILQLEESLSLKQSSKEDLKAIHSKLTGVLQNLPIVEHV